MDGLNEKETPKEKRGLAALRGGDGAPRVKAATGLDIAAFAVALLFARCHLIFGAHPAAIALLAVLPGRIWYALAGAVVGSLTLGKAGIIYSMISVIVVFLRVIIYGGEKTDDEGARKRLFSEKLLLRLCAAVIGGFIIAVYEVLLSGFTKTSVLFGLSMIIISPLLSLVFSGLFDSGISLTELLKGGTGIFTTSGMDESKRLNSVFFRISASVIIFIISLSLKEFELLGISTAYIFSAFVTLTVAKRFGVLHGAVIGFVSALGLSHAYAVSFALAGVAAGLLFKIGVVYALVGGCALLSLWSAYSAGLTGFLTTFPEYVIGAALAYPLFKLLPSEKAEEEVRDAEKSAHDMVGTMALAFQNRYTGSLDALELALSELSGVIASFGRSGNRISADEYRDIIIEEADRFCRSCSGLRMCITEDIRPFINNASALAEKLENKEKLTAQDVSMDSSLCDASELIAEAINRRAAILEEERYRLKETVTAAEDYAIISKMINEARLRDEAEKAMDTALSEKLGEIFRKCGFSDGVIRVFGERKKHIICAGEDEDGSKITSPELKAGIESVAGIRLGTPEYFRRGKIALMECSAEQRLFCECATAAIAGSEKEISGDTSRQFESRDDRFFALISDGMGSGEVAMQTSSFVGDFLSGMLLHGYSKETVLHILNGIIRTRGSECSATVDLFELDLITAEASFVKSGAASSYVKRDSSIFRIRSRTAPIGLMKSVDAEKIRVEIQSGDYVIMLSDGVNQSPEEAPWLIELLAKPAKRNIQEYADAILKAAIENNPPRDDMTVTVIKINAK